MKSGKVEYEVIIRKIHPGSADEYSHEVTVFYQGESVRGGQARDFEESEMLAELIAKNHKAEQLEEGPLRYTIEV